MLVEIYFEMFLFCSCLCLYVMHSDRSNFVGSQCKTDLVMLNPMTKINKKMRYSGCRLKLAFPRLTEGVMAG